MFKHVFLVVMASGLVAACASNSKDAKVDSKAAAAEAEAAEAQAAESKKQTEVKAAAAGSSFECVLKNDTRKVELVSLKPVGCELMYTKAGQTEKIASSANGNTHCETVRDRIRGRLEGAGYACK